jgi:hypothetical protein
MSSARIELFRAVKKEPASCCKRLWREDDLKTTVCKEKP